MINKLKGYMIPLILLIIAIIFPLIFRSNYLLHILIISYAYICGAQGWNILGGYTGQISFGQAAYWGLGAYVMYIGMVHFEIPALIGLFIGALVAGLFGYLTAIPCSKLRSTFYSLTTLAFTEVLLRIATLWKNVTNGHAGLTPPFKGVNFLWLQFDNKVAPYYVILTLMVASILIVKYIDSSMFGMKLRAIREGHEAAESLGINSPREKLRAAAISGFITGLGGAFYCAYVYVVDPNTAFISSQTVYMIVYAAVGGMGTVAGPVIGGLLICPMNLLLNSFFSSRGFYGVNMIIFSLLIILVVLFKPKGLMGIFYDFQRARKKEQTT